MDHCFFFGGGCFVSFLFVDVLAFVYLMFDFVQRIRFFKGFDLSFVCLF